MPPKSKNKKMANAETPKKKGKSSSRRKQSRYYQICFGVSVLYFHPSSFLPLLRNVGVKQVHLQSCFSPTFTMPPKSKNNKTANPETPKKKGKSGS